MQKITELEKEKGSLEQSYVEKITALKDKHRQALDHAEAMKGVAIKEAKADAKEQAQVKIDAHMETEAKLRREIDELRKEVYASNNRIREIEEARYKEITGLKEEIDELKKISAPAPVEKKSTGAKKTGSKVKEKVEVTELHEHNITRDEIKIEE